MILGSALACAGFHSDIERDYQLVHITFRHKITSSGERAELLDIFKTVNFCLHESYREVCVDDTSGFWCT